MIDLVTFDDDAACVGADTNKFFPHTGETSKPAKAICKDCKVKTECLDWAIKHKITYGIWGGKTVRERRAITKELVATGVQLAKKLLCRSGEEAPVVTYDGLDAIDHRSIRMRRGGL